MTTGPWGTFAPVSKKITRSITVHNNQKIQFWDTGMWIGATADGALSIVSDGTIALSGTLTHTGDMTITGSLTITGDLTFGDAAVDNFIIKGRTSTMTAAGSAITFDGTTDTYSEGMELRYTMGDWDGVTSTFTTVKGMYLRADTTEANGSGSVYGLELYGSTNNVSVGYVWGALVYAYVKGSAAKTLSGVYALQPEISFDAGSGTNTITDACVVRAKVTGGVMSNYTVLDGYRLTLGDMDGGSRTYGNGLIFEDDSDMSGTCALTTGINLNIACTTGISVAGACTDGLIISGACSDNGIEISGACTDSAIQVVTGGFATGLNINADGTTAMAVQSTFSGTTGLLLAGTHSNAISITGTSTVAGLNIGGDNTIGINIAAQTTSALNISGATATGIVISGATTTGVHLVTGAFTTGLSIDADGTTAMEVTSNFTGTTMLALGGTATNAIDITGSSTTGIAMASGNMTNLFSTFVTNGPAVATVEAGDANGGSIAILVAGSTKYLHYWNSAA